VLASAGQWITNEKMLVDRAGLRDLDRIAAGLEPSPRTLTAALDHATAVLAEAIAVQ